MSRSFLTRRRAIWAVAVLIVVAAIVFVVQVVLVAVALNAAKRDGEAASKALAAGDLSAARAAAKRLESDGSDAATYTSGPLWWIGSHVPFLGRDVSAVQDSATALDAIATHSLPVLLNLADAVQHGSLRPSHGRISPEAIASFAPALHTAAQALDGPASTIEQLDTSSLLPPLDSLMAHVKDKIAQAKTAIDAAAKAFEVLPTMLGGHGPRDYLLLVQNPTELRSAGGLPGTWAILHADDGRVKMVSTTFLLQLQIGKDPIVPTAEESALWGSDYGASPYNITQTPDFPRAAQIAAAMEKRRGVNISAVFSVDPVALSYVLRGTGPVRLQPGTVLTAHNAAGILLNKVYELNDMAAQNRVFSLAAHKIFGALVSGQGSQLRAIRGLIQGFSEHRVFAWTPDPALAPVIDDQRLTGAFPTDTGKTPQVGIYLNEASPSKIDYYLRQSESVVATSCHNGIQTLQLKLTLQSTISPIVRGRSPWIVGFGITAPIGHMLLDTFVAGPWHGTVDEMAQNGRPLTVIANRLDGRQMSDAVIDLAPGQSVTITATMHTGAGQTGSGSLLWTPGMGSGSDPVSFASACS